jgi:hypothetical protein
MCYLLIGNIAALISDDCAEPLANARIRVYLPASNYSSVYHPEKNIGGGPRELSPVEVEARQERLLAETRLNERGNFTLGWEEVHLFTEPLELVLCLDKTCVEPAGEERRLGQTCVDFGSPDEGGAGDQAKGREMHLHLGTITPSWKYSGWRYVAAYAYMIPADCWSAIRAIYGTWVIAGTVKRNYPHPGQTQYRVEVFNASNHRLLASGETDDEGRYQLRFSRSVWGAAPAEDVYFRVYAFEAEHWKKVLQLEKKALPACSAVHFEIPAARTHQNLFSSHLTYKSMMSDLLV